MDFKLHGINLVILSITWFMIALLVSVKNRRITKSARYWFYAGIAFLIPGSVFLSLRNAESD